MYIYLIYKSIYRPIYRLIYIYRPIYRLIYSNIEANIYGGGGGGMVMGGIVMGGYDKRYIFHGGNGWRGKVMGGNDSYSLKSQSKVCACVSRQRSKYSLK